MFFLALVYAIILIVGVIFSWRSDGWNNLPMWVLFAILGYVAFWNVLNK